MEIVAGNLNFRRPALNQAMRDRYSGPIQDLAQECKKRGADYINLYLGSGGDAEDMKFVVSAVQEVCDLRLFLDAVDPKVVEAGIKECCRPPIINGVSGDPAVRDPLISLAERYETEVVVLAERDGTPRDADERLEILEELVEAANAANITNDRIIVDPIILHLGGGIGQEHSVAVQEVLRVLPETFTQPIRSVCWISNISAGIPEKLRPAVNSVYMAMLAGQGLDMAMVNAMDPEIMRTARLIKALKNEELFAIAEAELG